MLAADGAPPAHDIKEAVLGTRLLGSKAALEGPLPSREVTWPRGQGRAPPGQRAKCELIVRGCWGPQIGLVRSGEGAVAMATFVGSVFSSRRAWKVQEVEGCEECTRSPKGEQCSLPGAVVYSRELLERRGGWPGPVLGLPC